MLPRGKSTPFRGIYAIRHVASGRIYVGSAVDFQARWSQHRRDLRNNTHDNRYLQAAWDKYGPGAFVFEILEAVRDKDDLIPREQEWLDGLEPWKAENGFNLCAVAGSPLGIKRTDETRAKMSEIGRQRSPEAIAKFSEAGKTPEALAKKSEKLKGRTFSEDRKANMKAAWKPRTYTPEYRAKLSAAKKGKENTPEQNAKIGDKHRGKVLSEGTKAKIAAKLTGRKNGPHSEETKAKMSAAKMGNKARLGIKASEETKAKMRAAWERRRAREQAEKQPPPAGQMLLAFDD